MKPITEKDFVALADWLGLHPDIRPTMASNAFEIAKRMAIDFGTWMNEKGYIPTDQSKTFYKRQENQILWSEPVSREQLFELYQQQNNKP